MDEEQEKKQGFKIVDRRRFDSEGEERSVSESRSSDKPAQAQVDSGAKAGESGQHGVEINFSSFVMSLATQALMQLGDIKPPDGIEIPRDPQAAKQTIEILGLLQEKTKGNLDKEEEYLIEEMLHNLRLRFVKVAQK